MKKIGCIVTAVLFLSACGGGGGGSSEAPQNAAPVAVVGEDVAVMLGSEVLLDASGSYDPDGDPITTRWTITGKNVGSVALDDPTAPEVLFAPTEPDAYTLALVVDDGSSQSDPAEAVAFVIEPYSGEQGQVLVLQDQNKILGWLVDENLESTETHIRNGYPHLLDRWFAGEVWSTEVAVPFEERYHADLYEVVDGVIYRRDI